MGYEVKDRSLIINEEEKPIIKFIYEKFAETESYFMVTDLLNNSGYRTKIRHLNNGKISGGGKFQPNAVLHILKNPYYKGCVTHKGQVYQGQHEAIIPENEWEQVQEIFSKHGGGARKHDKIISPSFLKGIIRCESCDTPDDSELLRKKRHEISLLCVSETSEIQIVQFCVQNSSCGNSRRTSRERNYSHIEVS